MLNQRSQVVSCLEDRKYVVNHLLKKKKKRVARDPHSNSLSDLYGHRLGPIADSIFVASLSEDTEGTNKGPGEIQECSQHITKGVESGSQLHYWYIRQGPLKRWLMCSFYNWQEDRTQSSVTDRYTMWR